MYAEPKDFSIEEGERLRKLVGKSVRAVDVEAPGDRIKAVTLMFENGASLTVSFFAVYADDAGLEFTLDGVPETQVPPW